MFFVGVRYEKCMEGVYMDIREMRYFTAVAECGTVTAAARQLNISQPPLSAQIRLLEGELGCELFIRSARKMELTETGKILYMRARGILDLCQSVEKEITDLNGTASGTLRIGAASSIVCSSLFTEIIKTFADTHRGIRYEITENNTFQLIDSLKTHQIELAFVRTPFKEAGLETISLISEPFCAVADSRAFNELCKIKDSVTLRQLSGYPLIEYRRWQNTLSSVFEKENLEPDFRCIADDARTVMSLTECGMGVGIVPKSAVQDKDGLVMREIKAAGLNSEICAVCCSGFYISENVRELMDMLKATASQGSRQETSRK